MLKRRTFFILEAIAAILICCLHSYLMNHFDGLIGRSIVNTFHSLCFGLLLGFFTYKFAKWATNKGWVEESEFDKWIKAEKASHQKRMIEVEVEILREARKIRDEHRH